MEKKITLLEQEKMSLNAELKELKDRYVKLLNS